MEDQKTSLGALLTKFSSQISTLFRAEIALSKAQAKESGKRFGLAAGLFGAAAVFALFMLGWLLAALFIAFANLFGAGLVGWVGGALVTAAVLLVITGILAGCGVAAAKAAAQKIPAPAAGVKKNVEIIKESAKNAVLKVNEGSKEND